MPNLRRHFYTLLTVLRQQLSELITFNHHTRPWHMPIMAAISVSFPIFLAAYLGQLPYGLTASLGAMVFLNLPYQGSFLFRMMQILACSFGFVACFSLGVMTHLLPILTLPFIGFVSFWVALFTRYYRLSPPAGVFMIMSASIGLFIPIESMQIPFYVGLIALGCLFSGMIACLYTLITMYQKHDFIAVKPFYYHDDMLVDSTVVALTMVLATATALALDMPRPYWVTASCFVIITGMTFRSMWTKQIQRIIGTAFGMITAWCLLSLNLNPWGIAIAIMLLVATIETLIVRNYALAIIFVTPMTLLIAESGQHANGEHLPIILARFWDTLVGCTIGVIGGLVMHNHRIRPKLHQLDCHLRNKFHIH